MEGLPTAVDLNNPLARDLGLNDIGPRGPARTAAGYR
jgi:hypothetical protein